jgi:hypothetical protein
MKLYIPQNIFSSILISTLPKDSGFDIIKKESAILCKQLGTDTSGIALVPSLELINHQTLFISSKLGISFDGVLSNSYLYFPEKEKTIEKLKVRGDASINEIVLAKIIFEEHFSSKVEIILDSIKEKSITGDYLIIGDENFEKENYQRGISFSDEIAEMLDFPYVNFVFVSHDKESLEYFNSFFTNIDAKIEDNLKNILAGLNYTEQVKSFITENLGSVYFEMTWNEVEAVKEMMKLVYYHRIINDIFDLKFV